MTPTASAPVTTKKRNKVMAVFGATLELAAAAAGVKVAGTGYTVDYVEPRDDKAEAPTTWRAHCVRPLAYA